MNSGDFPHLMSFDEEKCTAGKSSFVGLCAYLGNIYNEKMAVCISAIFFLY